MGVSLNTVSLWSKRFDEKGLKGLSDAPGRGRKACLAPEKIRKVITEVTQPPPGRKKWSTRTMAAAVGMSHQSVHSIWEKTISSRIWCARSRSPTLRGFEEKFWDIIGLYLEPPDKALVLCCDEKSQCQALEREPNPACRLGIGHIRTRTHDYKRHGTITLFAALNYLEGKLITRTGVQAHARGMAPLPQADRP